MHTFRWRARHRDRAGERAKPINIPVCACVCVRPLVRVRFKRTKTADKNRVCAHTSAHIGERVPNGILLPAHATRYLLSKHEPAHVRICTHISQTQHTHTAHTLNVRMWPSANIYVQTPPLCGARTRVRPSRTARTTHSFKWVFYNKKKLVKTI